MNYLALDLRVGQLLLHWTKAGLVSKIELKDSSTLPSISNPRHRTLMVSRRRIPFHLIELLEKLRCFAEEGHPINAVPWNLLDQNQLSEFQSKVYHATENIPHGETRSYAWVSERIGNPLAHRAVGQALSKNPFPILVPCHRVVTSQGALGGFMGKSDPNDSEVVLKEKLIRSEHEYRNPVFEFLEVTSIERSEPAKEVAPSIVRRGELENPAWTPAAHETA